jgi:AcrR family transcriptional regulator
MGVTSITQHSGTRRRMAAPDRRLAILEAAREAFAEGGYHRTSLGSVAERAGVSKALLYEHFSGKRELHAAMLELHVDELVARINAALVGAEPGEERLRAGLEAFFGFLEERRGASRIMLRNTGDPDVLLWLGRLRDEIGAAIVTLMTEDAREVLGEDPGPVVLEMVAQQLIGAMQSLADWWTEHPEVPRETLVTTALDFTWVGLERLSQGERWGAARATD